MDTATEDGPRGDEGQIQSDTNNIPLQWCSEARWQENFERLAKRAANCPEFYEIAGGSIQCRADQIRGGDAA